MDRAPHVRVVEGARPVKGREADEGACVHEVSLGLGAAGISMGTGAIAGAWQCLQTRGSNPSTARRISATVRGARAVVGGGRCSCGEERASAFEPVVHVTRGEQAEVSDLGEARREDVEQESAEEFLGWEGDFGSGLGGEAHALERDAAYASIGDADAMGVAAEIANDVLGTAEGAFRVNDPSRAAASVEEANVVLRVRARLCLRAPLFPRA